MSLKENYVRKDSELSNFKDNESSIDAVKYLLMNEHKLLLKILEPARIINRSILLGITLLQISGAPLPLWRSIAFLAIGALAATSWYIQGRLIRQKLDRLGELITDTCAEQLAGMKTNQGWPVVIRPPKEPLSEAKMPNTQIEQVWINTYINWRHERWKNTRPQALQRLEPVIWFILILFLSILQIQNR